MNGLAFDNVVQHLADAVRHVSNVKKALYQRFLVNFGFISRMADL